MTENVEQNLIYVSVFISFNNRTITKSHFPKIIFESLGKLTEPVAFVVIYLFYPEIFFIYEELPFIIVRNELG